MPALPVQGWEEAEAAREVLLRLSDGEDHGTSRKAWHRVIRERKTEFQSEFTAGPASDVREDDPRQQ